MKKKTFIIFVALFAIVEIQAQCNPVETITICDMTGVDSDNNGPPDGIINLYDAYNAIAADPILLTDGVWFDPNFNFALDPTTGNLHVWDLKNASETITDYQFQLINTSSSCPDGIVTTVNLILGPFSGFARPVLNIDDVNLEVCDVGSTPEDICVELPDVDLFEALESIPSPHLNGQWIYNGTSPNFISLSGSSFSVTIPYNSGPPLVDQETFELTYRVTGIAPCNATVETTVNVSVTRQVFSGYEQNKRICELDIINGNYNSDLNLNDNQFLLFEDIEGSWGTDSYGQITAPNDSSVNLNEIYQQIIASNGVRFGCAEIDFMYSVSQRSGVCEDAMSTVSFKIYEYLRSFSQNETLEFCEDTETTPETLNLYEQLEFTTENDVLFDYFDFTHTDWNFISGPSDLGLISNDIGAIGYTPLGTINLSDASPGTYIYQYTVFPEINCPSDNFVALDYSANQCNPLINDRGFCGAETARVVLTIHPKLYAGENTIDLEFCENDPLIANPIDLFSLLETNGVDSIYEGPLGTWTDLDSGLTITNPITLTEVDNQQTYNFAYGTLTANNCENTANLSFTIYEEYQAGVGESIEICNINESFNLFDNLTGNPNTTGTWSGPNGYSTTNHNAIFNPSTFDAGIYTYTVPANVNINGTAICAGGDSATITIEINQSPNAGNDMLGIVCPLLDFEIDLTDFLDTAAGTGGVFIDTDQTNLLSGNILDVSQLDFGTYNFQYEIQGHLSCPSSSSQISITVNEVSKPLAVNQTFCASDGATVADLQADNGISYNWYDAIDATIPLSFNTVLINGEDYFVTALDEDDCESSRIQIFVTLLPIDHVDCDDCIKDGVTANEDGINDEFDLCDLPVTFPNFEINIYNRYGTLVYKGNKNTPLFNGESNVPLTIGKGLPTGIYFYVFDPKDINTKVFQGNFYLSR